SAGIEVAFGKRRSKLQLSRDVRGAQQVTYGSVQIAVRDPALGPQAQGGAEIAELAAFVGDPERGLGMPSGLGQLPGEEAGFRQPRAPPRPTSVASDLLGLAHRAPSHRQAFCGAALRRQKEADLRCQYGNDEGDVV